VIPSLCEFCRHLQEVVSGKGSRFLLCQKSGADSGYPLELRTMFRQTPGK